MTTTTDLSPDAYAAMRSAMVSSQLRTTAVNDPRVVAAMARVPRERFLPGDMRAFAYRDGTLPLGRGRYLNLPMATGRLLTEAYLTPADRVLLIGAATGYTAAVLAELVAHVTAVESDAILLAIARDALGNHPKVELVQGDLETGAPDRGLHDVMIIDGAIEFVPDTLLGQVRTDGRVTTGLVDGGVIRLATGRRTSGGFGLATFADVECVVLPGFSRPRRFTF